MKKKFAGAVAALCTAGAVAGAVTAGSAEAGQNYSIKLTRAETAVVATHGLGTAFSTIPRIPHLILNPGYGRSIQEFAEYSAGRGGCIGLGITVDQQYTVNSVTAYPASACA
ncbi:hypothetical protein GOHSU_26_00020 [Gordonia hirsuta DSM 44140 = NBRC 16056]|uniref:Uncharacterized protein n=1 Tax=Gordonia hirsuta DSM 44140 = NBRC 16056 TaxID=1121927 RepID=L7L9M7_9ACTN|nr:hypothetical protein [Gordonia hirsuta]GAC57845.1 hypothetical protein GOHSU_26_00020 [Gordonia hirsuta DSM 44140 = NBRC 16056]